MTLEEMFEKYKNLLIKMIEVTEMGELDLLNELVEEKGSLMKEMLQLEKNKELLKSFFFSDDIQKLDSKLKLTVENSMKEKKVEIGRLMKNRTMNRKYNNLTSKSVYLSKKI